MSGHAVIHEKARAFFEDLWGRGDYWNLEGSQFESQKYTYQLDVLAPHHYARALEIGCGAGVFTRRLARIVTRVVALDISPTAIERAKAMGGESGSIEFRAANVMEYDPHADGPWDLVVMSETIYYLGWLYPFFNVGWLAAQLFDATRPGGRLLMANTFGGVEDYLLRPWLIHTYRDLFLNVGYKLRNEEIFRGSKDGIQLDVLITLFEKPLPHIMKRQLAEA
jgi:SAM-dependent methyltransferase